MPKYTRDAVLTSPEIPQPAEEAGISLLEILSVLAERRRIIAPAGLAGGVIAATIAFFMPNTYTAAAVIMPPQKEQSSASALLGQLGPLAAVTGADFGLKNPGDLYIGLLNSRTIADRIIGKFGLRGIYKTKTATDTRAALKNHVRFKSGRDSLITIEVDDTDPNRAAELANAFVSELNAQNRFFAITDASQRRAFLDKQLADEKAALAEAEEAMKRLQSQTGLIHLDGQTSVAIGSAAQLRAQITAEEVSLERLKIGATPQNPEVLRIEAELAALREQLQKLERTPAPGTPFLPTSALPEAGLEYVRRVRELKYHEFLFELLSKQYEAARIDESKAAPALQVVDPAVSPDKKTGPRRALITAFGCVAAIVLSSILAYILHRPSLRSTQS